MPKSGLVKAIIAAITFAASLIASADTLKRDIFACSSENFTSEMMGFQNSKDANGVKQLITSGKCLYLDQGEKISILRPGIIIATIQYKGRRLLTPADSLR